MSGRTLAHAVQTPPSWRTHVGYHLELFGVAEPRPGARRLPPELAAEAGHGELWVVYAVAWRSEDGPWAEWWLEPDGQARLSYSFPHDHPTAADLAELGRCADLLLGRSARLGRPSRSTDPTWRQIAAEAESRKAARPGLAWAIIADLLGVDQRTLRQYRQELRRERGPGGTAETPLILVEDASDAESTPSDPVRLVDARAAGRGEALHPARMGRG